MKRKLLLQKLNRTYTPNKVILLKSNKNKKELKQLVPFTKNYEITNKNLMVYVCRNFVCNIPTDDIKTILELLDHY
ncbi:MAG: hypothetical protein L3J41_11245 [Melioribacteraceae bacterium]|nr:hypothetical protein [Melioribacteraceae bacterium]